MNQEAIDNSNVINGVISRLDTALKGIRVIGRMDLSRYEWNIDVDQLKDSVETAQLQLRILVNQMEGKA